MERKDIDKDIRYKYIYLRAPFLLSSSSKVSAFLKISLLQNNIYIYTKHQTCSWRSVLDTTLSDKVCHWLAAGQWISPGIPVSSTNKTGLQDIAELLLKASLNTIALTLTQNTKPPDLEYSDYLTRYTDLAQCRSTCREFMCDVTIKLIPDIFTVNCFFH